MSGNMQALTCILHSLRSLQLMTVLAAYSVLAACSPPSRPYTIQIDSAACAWCSHHCSLLMTDDASYHTPNPQT
jgi:hypothetical protein